MYRNDSSLDLSFELCQKTKSSFGVSSMKATKNYKELATLAMLLLSVSPCTSVICELAFSSMNYIKNEFRSVLSQAYLNACMSIVLCNYSSCRFLCSVACRLIVIITFFVS